jgi:hypothetical protein
MRAVWKLITERRLSEDGRQCCFVAVLAEGSPTSLLVRRRDGRTRYLMQGFKHGGAAVSRDSLPAICRPSNLVGALLHRADFTGNNSLATWGQPPAQKPLQFGVRAATLDHTRSLDPEWSGSGLDSASTNPCARSAAGVMVASKMRPAQRSEARRRAGFERQRAVGALSATLLR